MCSFSLLFLPRLARTRFLCSAEPINVTHDASLTIRGKAHLVPGVSLEQGAVGRLQRPYRWRMRREPRSSGTRGWSIPVILFPPMSGEQGCSYPLWLCRLRRRQRKHRHAIQGIASQSRDDVSGHFGGDAHLCLNRGGSQVWRGNDPLMCEQVPQDHIIADRLLTEDIERHSSQSSLHERSQQRLLVDQVASSAVHQVGTGLEQRQFTCAKKHARPAL